MGQLQNHIYVILFYFFPLLPSQTKHTRPIHSCLINPNPIYGTQHCSIVSVNKKMKYACMHIHPMSFSNMLWIYPPTFERLPRCILCIGNVERILRRGNVELRIWVVAKHLLPSLHQIMLIISVNLRERQLAGVRRTIRSHSFEFQSRWRDGLYQGHLRTSKYHNKIKTTPQKLDHTQSQTLFFFLSLSLLYSFFTESEINEKTKIAHRNDDYRSVLSSLWQNNSSPLERRSTFLDCKNKKIDVRVCLYGFTKNGGYYSRAKNTQLMEICEKQKLSCFSTSSFFCWIRFSVTEGE